MVYFFLNIFIVIFALHWMLFLRRSSSRNVLYIYISMCIRVPESRSWKQFWKWFGNCGTAFRGGVVLLLLNKFWHGSLFFFSKFILERRKPFSVMIRRIEIFSNSRLHFVGMNIESIIARWLFRDGMRIVLLFYANANIEISDDCINEFPREFSDGRVIIRVSELHWFHRLRI